MVVATILPDAEISVAVANASIEGLKEKLLVVEGILVTSILLAVTVAA